MEKTSVGLRTWLVWMGLGLVLAMLAEGLHYWIPHRSFNPMDALFNSLGVLMGGVVLVMKSAASPILKAGSKIFKPGWSLLSNLGKDLSGEL